MKESTCYLFSQMNSAWGICPNLFWNEIFSDGDMPSILSIIFHSNYLIKTNKILKDKLESLPGIGPTIAQRNIGSRPFYLKNSLQNMKSIGDKRYVG